MKVYKIYPKYDWIELTIEYADFIEVRMMMKDEFKRKYADKTVVSIKNQDTRETTLIKIKIDEKKGI